MGKDDKVLLATFRRADSRAIVEKGMGTSLMSTAGAARSLTQPNVEVDADSVAQSVVVVYDCTRLGRTANPPFSFLDWFRIGRRRR